MTGIIPTEEAGGVVVRDGGGNCVGFESGAPTNAYCPGPDFGSGCEIRYLPDDCSARIFPRQINAIESEMLCLAEAFTPEGNWNCGSLCNLSMNFTNWLTSSVRFEGSYLDALQNHLCAMEFVESLASFPDASMLICNGEGNVLRAAIPTGGGGGGNICDDPAALEALIDCLPWPSMDAFPIESGNLIASFTDQNANIVDIYESSTSLSMDEISPGLYRVTYISEGGGAYFFDLPNECCVEEVLFDGDTRTLSIIAGNGTFDVVIPAGGGVGATDLGYVAASRLVTSSTGAGAVLPLVTSGEAGLAPASGGGTTNFLRADGTWAAPAGGGGGGGISVITAAPIADQTNWSPAGLGTGETMILMQPTTNCFLSGITGATANQVLHLVNDSDFVVMITENDTASTAANRFIPDTGSTIILPHETVSVRYSSRLSRWAIISQSRDLNEVNFRTQLTLPSSGASVQNMGTGSTNTLGTLSTINATAFANHDFEEYSRTKIFNTTSGGAASIRGTQAWVFRGAATSRQGFLHTARVRFDLLNPVGGVWAGLLNTTATITSQPSTFTEALVLGANGGAAHLSIIHNDGSGAATSVSLGANFPVPDAAAAYEYLFYSQPNGSQIEYMVRRIDTRFVTQGSLTTDIPGHATALTPWLGVMVGASSSACSAQMNYMKTIGL